MLKHTIVFKLFCIGFWGPIVASLGTQVFIHRHEKSSEWTIGIRLSSFIRFLLILCMNNEMTKPAVDWWCDEIECFYSDAMPKEDRCDSNNSIPYRFNYMTGACELNLKGLLLSFRILNNRLAAAAQERSRKRSEIIFQGIIISGKIFVGFASVCVFMGCFYCCWVQYSDLQLRKSVKAVAKKILTPQQSNKTKQETGKKEDKAIRKFDKCETVVEEIETSVL